MVVPPERVPDLLAGLALLGLAGWIFYLRPGNRLHQAFALFLSLRGVMFVLLSVQGLGMAYLSLRIRLLVYLFIAIPFAAFYFGHAFRNRFGPQTRLGEAVSPRILPWALLLGAAILIGMYIANRDVFFDLIAPLQSIEMLSYTALAILLLRDADRSKFAPDRKALHLVSVSLLLEAGHVAPHFAMVFHPFQPEPLLPADMASWILWVVVIGAILYVAGTRLVRLARARTPPERSADVRYLAFMAVPLATGVATGFVTSIVPSSPLAYPLFVSLGGVWGIISALVLAYAIVEHGLFDIDIKVKFVVRQSTLAGVFVAVFFVVSEGTAEMLGGATNEYVGILAAAMLLFAIHPLQRLAERFSDKAMPEVEDTPEYRQVRQKEVYRAVYESALREGTVSAEDRKVLGALRTRFGIQTGEARRMEMEVLDALALEGGHPEDEVGEYGTRLGLRLPDNT